MMSWSKFSLEAPAIADTGRRLLYGNGDVANAYLATVAPDGGPRVHPVCPVLAGDDLWMFIVDMSPKYRDLLRNRRFALHTFPTPAGGEEFHVRGSAVPIDDRERKDTVIAATGGRQGAHDFEALFRCELESALYTRWDHWGTASAWPNYDKWVASR